MAGEKSVSSLTPCQAKKRGSRSGLGGGFTNSMGAAYGPGGVFTDSEEPPIDETGVNFPNGP